jgi:hypothetical protein
MARPLEEVRSMTAMQVAERSFFEPAGKRYHLPHDKDADKAEQGAADWAGDPTDVSGVQGTCDGITDRPGEIHYIRQSDAQCFSGELLTNS